MRCFIWLKSKNKNLILRVYKTFDCADERWDFHCFKRHLVPNDTTTKCQLTTATVTTREARRKTFIQTQSDKQTDGPTCRQVERERRRRRSNTEIDRWEDNSNTTTQQQVNSPVNPATLSALATEINPNVPSNNAANVPTCTAFVNDICIVWLLLNLLLLSLSSFRLLWLCLSPCHCRDTSWP